MYTNSPSSSTRHRVCRAPRGYVPVVGVDTCDTRALRAWARAGGVTAGLVWLLLLRAVWARYRAMRARVWLWLGALLIDALVLLWVGWLLGP